MAAGVSALFSKGQGGGRIHEIFRGAEKKSKKMKKSLKTCLTGYGGVCINPLTSDGDYPGKRAKAR